MRGTNRFWIAATTLAAYATPALAQVSTSSGSGTSVGDRIKETISSTVGPVIFVISLCSFVAGLYFMAKGLVKLKDIASGQRNETSHALMCIVAATCLICLPELAGVGVTSVFGQDGLFGNSDLKAVQDALDAGSGNPASGAVSNIVSHGSVQAPDNCLSSSGSGGSGGGEDAAACMAGNLAKNVVPIGVMGIFVFAFIMGLTIFAGCIYELTNGDGQPKSGSFWGKLFGSVMLMNAIFAFIAVSNTLLGDSQSTITMSGVNTGSSMLSYTSSTNGVLAQYAKIIGYVFVILVFFGAFAFVKGIFLIKDASEGRGQATYSHGMVFLFAGILLANAKYTTCLILSTISSGSGNTAGFC